MSGQKGREFARPFEQHEFADTVTLGRISKLVQSVGLSLCQRRARKHLIDRGFLLAIDQHNEPISVWIRAADFMGHRSLLCPLRGQLAKMPDL